MEPPTPTPLKNRKSRKSQKAGAKLATAPNVPLTARETTRTLRLPLRSARNPQTQPPTIIPRKMLAVRMPMSAELSWRSQRAVGSRNDTHRISTASLAFAHPQTTNSSQWKRPNPAFSTASSYVSFFLQDVCSSEQQKHLLAA